MSKIILDTKAKWTKASNDFLKGKIVARVRFSTKAEMKTMDWYAGAVSIEFTDGSWVMAMQDDEGNGPGALFTSSDDLPIIPVMHE